MRHQRTDVLLTKNLVANVNAVYTTAKATGFKAFGMDQSKRGRFLILGAIAGLICEIDLRTLFLKNLTLLFLFFGGTMFLQT